VQSSQASVTGRVIRRNSEAPTGNLTGFVPLKTWRKPGTGNTAGKDDSLELNAKRPRALSKHRHLFEESGTDLRVLARLLFW